MNTPDKLFVNSANMTRKHVQITAAKYSVTTMAYYTDWTP